MKKIYPLSFFCLLSLSAMLHAQPIIYSQSIIQPSVNLRAGTVELGSITATFPTGGHVVVHFDGECYAAVGDRINLAATGTGDWTANDGHVAIENSKPGFGRPFSHTRVYPVTAGSHTYYAVGQNAVETDGTGVATIYGTLTVEFFPDTEQGKVESTGFVFSGNVANTTVVKEQTIHVNGPGKVLVRFDGWITSDISDRVVLAASNTMNWGFDDGNVAVEAVNAGDVDENSFSHTRVYNVSSAGDYTYYALAQVWGKAFGDGNISVYGNLLVEYYPTEGQTKLSFDGFSHTTIDLNGGPTELTSLTINAPVAGKVMVTLDGYMTADTGYTTIVAASNTLDWTANDGNITLTALDLDQNRYSFSHTRVYNVTPGQHTYYGVGEITGGSGSKTSDLFGALTVKYFPSTSTPVSDIVSGKFGFDIYPNPALDEVHIAFKNYDAQEKVIQVMNLNGQVLSEYQTNAIEELKIDLSNYPANLYWVKIGEMLKPLVRL
jgi:hypothetical protein